MKRLKRLCIENPVVIGGAIELIAGIFMLVVITAPMWAR